MKQNEHHPDKKVSVNLEKWDSETMTSSDKRNVSKKAKSQQSSDDWESQESFGRPVIHSFIVRVWQEEGSSKDASERWRGHITEIRDGEREYFNDLADIPLVISAHLQK